MSTPIADSNADKVLAYPAASTWLKCALRDSLERDPVDALNDTLILAAILDFHLRVALGLPEAE